jgi:hypothetical protein
MTDKDFVKNLRKLKEITPDKEWVIFSKDRILGKEEKGGVLSALELVPKFIFRYNKFAFAVLIFFGFLTGAFTFAQNSLPGDPAFVLKKAIEKTKTAFASQSDRTEIQLELANKRLDDLNKIAQSNQPDKLAPAIQEFQSNISKAAQDLISANGRANVKEIVLETQKIREAKEKIEALGVVVGGTDDLDGAFLQLLQNEINDLQIRTLDEEQQKMFTEAVKDFNEGNYAEALEKIYSLGNKQE